MYKSVLLSTPAKEGGGGMFLGECTQVVDSIIEDGGFGESHFILIYRVN